MAPSPTLTALLDALAATIPCYGSLPFELDADHKIARGIIEKLGVGKIVRRDGMPPFPSDLRILPATVDNDAALDRDSFVIHPHFTRAASEALARIVGGLALCIGRCKRWLNARSLK